MNGSGMGNSARGSRRDFLPGRQSVFSGAAEMPGTPTSALREKQSFDHAMLNGRKSPVSSIGQRNTYLDGRTWSDEDEEKV